MEPAGWALVATSTIGMFSAIAVAMIQARKAKRPWNGLERRAMERVADEKVNKHILSCPYPAVVREEIAGFRVDFGKFREYVEGEFRQIRQQLFERH